ncbi:MAG: cytochrome c [Candidatus Obscuribacterales bacterium]|nr:cytochrome c [Candidatus Obscuribacterales bacterium]
MQERSQIQFANPQNIILVAMATAFCISLTVGSHTRVSAAPRKGSKIFKLHCAGCHPGGKNLTHPDKPIIGSKELASEATFKKFLSKRHGPMPPFLKIAKDDATVTALYKYVKTLK